MGVYVVLIILTAFAAMIRRGNVIRYFVFLIPTILIVGFKYEVGTDWHVYSGQFQTFSEIYPGSFFANFWTWVAFYAQEPLFILMSYIASQTLGSFELFYCIVYLFFIWSTFRVGRALGNTNVIAAFIPIHLFLLFTLEFSTLRQLIALAIFNLGLALTMRGNANKGLLFFLTAPLFQASTAIFIVVLFWIKATGRWTKFWLLICTVIVAGSAVVGFAQILNVFSFVLPPLIAVKINYYATVREYGVSVYEQSFSIIFYILVIYLCLKNRKSEIETIQFVATLTLYLSILALVSFAIPTVRNRLLYEIVILASLLMFTRGVRFRSTVRLLVIPMGIVFFAVSLTKQTSFMYVPYQNYIWYQITDQESDGWYRQSQLEALMQDRQND